MRHLSQACSFLQSPSFRQAQSALIGQLTQCIVIGRTPQAHVRNVTRLTIIMIFSFQSNIKTVNNVLVLPSVQANGEQSCVTDTLMMFACNCSSQATVKTAVLIGCSLHCGVTLFLSHTRVRHCAKLRI